MYICILFIWIDLFVLWILEISGHFSFCFSVFVKLSCGLYSRLMNFSKVQTKKGRIYYPNLKMDIHDAAIAGDLSALQEAIKSGEDVNSVDEVSWFVGM